MLSSPFSLPALKRAFQPMPNHANPSRLPPLELPNAKSDALSRDRILHAIDRLLASFDFSQVAFLRESIPNVRSPAQDRGYRLTVVLEGEKIIGFARNAQLEQATYPVGTSIFARKGAWQTASQELPFFIFGIVLENNYTRFLLVRNLGPSQPTGERFFLHTKRPPPTALTDVAASLTQALSLEQADQHARHWLIGSLVALARQELVADEQPAPASRSSIAQRKWEAIHQYLIEHFHEAISRDELGRKFGLTPSYLSQLYKRFAKSSFSASLMGMRLDHAANLLAHSHQSISEIAYRSGFNDTSYFTRSFHRRFQRSPRSYRLQSAPSRPSS